MQLEDWLDDLCVRFIVNLPPEELESVERICFQVEEAQWFYEDFIRVLDPSLPSLSLRAFSLRIFQHCPLFSTWSAQHHTTAFAEFLAYKQRVPVRGAIMLNDAMDEVVLVKGWKKGANWSFPRGKINKDETDLDCAVREVYEETGLDLNAAGLVKDEKEMKAIEITMREQHMKLFVFHGVPKDTYFEPRTRKEISKIEWYKLTELPTLKKHKHHDSGIESAAPAVNANKFYMVAPFLAPLKKWIGQQKKKSNRYSSHLAAPPLTANESELDPEPIYSTTQVPEEPHYVSDLPEVSVTKQADPSSHLKAILNIGQAQPEPAPMPSQPAHMPAVDAAKSNALLSLLRGNPTAELRATPSTPQGNISHLADDMQQPQYAQPQQFHSNQIPPSRHFQEQLEVSTSPPTQNMYPFNNMPGRNGGFDPVMFRQQQQSREHPVSRPQPAQQMAPYQQTGDPEFTRSQSAAQQAPAVPPASALPKLTNHTKSLLDVFRSVNSPPTQPVAAPAPNPQSQSLLNLLRTAPQPTTSASPLPLQSATSATPAKLTQLAQSPEMVEKVIRSSQSTVVHRPGKPHQNALLDLFSAKSPETKSVSRVDSITKVVSSPAELADTPLSGENPKQSEEEALLALLRQQKNTIKPTAPTSRQTRPIPKEGETGPTISGPLNQPNFEAVARAPRDAGTGLGRSPLTTHRTLYDPKQAPSMKILTRPEEQRQPKTQSPRPTKAKVAHSSPKKSVDKAAREAPKPFHPQILKRPQQAEGSEASSPTIQIQSSPRSKDEVALANSFTLSPKSSSVKSIAQVERRPSQADSQKQTLLSLFGGGGGSTNAPATSSQTPSRVVSPLSTSQIISPVNDVPVSAIEPISTRSRMGSMASNGSGGITAPGPRPSIEKRPTAAENKAFLLGYLGRIASQTG